MRWARLLTRQERGRLLAFGSVVALLHGAGWGLFLYFVHGDPAFAGTGMLAYALGLRHAFDADHIAAIDNTTRKLLQDGRRPLGVGFFFAIGHAAIVCVLALAVALAAAHFGGGHSEWQTYGDVVSASLSGSFLLLIGAMNLVVLHGTVRVWRELRRGRGDDEELAARLAERSGSRFVPRRLARRISASWHTLPLGIVFGLGFGSATELSLLTLTAGVGSSSPPFLAVLALPLLFAAGMTLVDTADGAVMTHAYGWAFADPLRKVYYNLVVTGASVAVALVIGSVRLLQVASSALGLECGVWGRLQALDFVHLGYFVVGLLAAAWAVSAAAWKVARA